LKNKVEVSAPGKLMLFGEHAVVYGKACIVTAVDQRIKVSVETVQANELFVEAPDVGVSGYSKSLDRLGEDEPPKSVKFIEYAVKNFNDIYKVKSGIKVKTKSDFSSKFGFGSSSAVTVGVLKAMSELFKVKMTNKRLFDLCYKTVLDVQGVGSGFDLAAAIWGGTLYFVGGGKKIIPLKTKAVPLVVGYTGIKADTTTLVKNVGVLYKDNSKEVGMIFDIIGDIVENAKKAILKNDYQRLGQLANMNQGLLDSLGVNTKELSNLIFAAREAGAYGAKLSGAGGGDCMIAFLDNKAKIALEKHISKKGGMIIHVKTGAEGVRVEGI